MSGLKSPSDLIEIHKRPNYFHLIYNRLNNQKIVVIDNAENLNINSYNALLKSIEEPHKNTFFLLYMIVPKRYPKLLNHDVVNLNFFLILLRKK